MLGSLNRTRKTQDKYFKDREEVSYQFLMEKIRHNKPLKRKDFMNGKMIQMAYSPKDKKSPYDRNPLILVIHATSRHVLGLNLHWMPPKGRILIIKMLLQANANNIKHNRPMSIDSGLAKQFWRLARPIFRKYIVSRISRRGVVIEPHEFNQVIMLPSERFIGVSSNVAWMTSLAQLRKRS